METLITKVDMDTLHVTLGELIVEYGTLIMLVQLLINELYPIDQNVWQLYATNLSDNNIIGIFGKLIVLNKPGVDQVQFKLIMSSLNEVVDGRNRFIHSTYTQANVEGTGIGRIKMPKEIGKAWDFRRPNRGTKRTDC